MAGQKKKFDHKVALQWPKILNNGMNSTYNRDSSSSRKGLQMSSFIVPTMLYILLIG